MERLNVTFIDERGISHEAGQFIVQENGRAIRMQFQYTESFVQNSELPSLDPVALKKTAGVISFDALPRVFDDCLPGGWGKRWLIRTKQLSRSEQRDFNLLKYMDPSHLGGLFFSDESEDSISDLETASALTEAILTLDEKGELITQAGLPTEAGHSSGGMRPKFTATLNGQPKLIKLESSQDKRDIVRLEHCCMAWAKQCNIHTANTSLLEIGNRMALSVDRFDINKWGGRHHKVSMRTLLQADEYTVGSYQDMAHLLFRYSADPKEDAKRLFEQMLFNIAIHNTDDHLRNFEVHFREGGWRLTPAYDLVPGDPGEIYHATRFGYAEFVDSWEDILKITKAFRLNPKEAEEIRNRILDQVNQLASIISNSGINDRDGQWLDQLIKQHTQLLFSH